MTTKAAFTADEWKTLQQAPLTAGMYITLASPSITDSMKESMAVARKIVEAATNKSSGELLTDLANEFKDFATARAAQPSFESRDLEKVKAEALADIQKAVSVLNSKATPAEATEFRQWLYDVAVAAAEAAKEGDFLGIGGTRVSEEEKAALASLSNALGL